MIRLCDGEGPWSEGVDTWMYPNDKVIEVNPDLDDPETIGEAVGTAVTEYLRQQQREQGAAARPDLRLVRSHVDDTAARDVS